MVAEVLSLVAIVLSGASLAWQIITWQRTGAVVQVLSYRVFDKGREGSSRTSYRLVVARNVGRSPMTVNWVGAETKFGRSVDAQTDHPDASPIPHRLEPGSDARWYLSDVKVNIFTEINFPGSPSEDLFAVVELADGRRIRCHRRL